MRPRRQPQRTCIGCRTVQDKRDLVRIVRTTEGSIELDTTGKKNGRGAYLCRNLECFDAAVAKKGLGKALRCSVSDEELSILRDEFGGLV
ncbi:MAG: YlxR family protein [Firmicutes bacterium]|nr:YlxR family protein [Bacillota bacterium]